MHLVLTVQYDLTLPLQSLSLDDLRNKGESIPEIERV
jgi:hypothetical protein